MKKYKKEQREVEVVESIVCDVCKKEFSYAKDKNEYILEMQEFQHIAFIGGFGSVFGDGASVRLDICQHCLKDKLGEYFVVAEENYYDTTSIVRKM